MYKENDVIRLIDKLYKDLYLSDDVIHHSPGNKYDKFGNIKRYLDRLERIHDSVRDTGRHKEFLKKMYYDRYVIKIEDIPESYYKHQQDIALERGYGHVEITDDMKRQYQEEIIDNQKKSLDIWLDYFLSEDAKDYSFWAKYWAFQGMLKLGNYDKEKGEFGRRTKDTVAPFVDLNREALAISIDLIIKLLNKEDIEDKELDVVVKSGSFQKIYTYVITHVLKDNKNITKKNNGVWVKYNQGTDHMVLVKSLQGYNTGWCTAGESTAKSQLANGDFYVYYTLDENDEYRVPRIAIRMEYGKIAEIRGVAENQNIESDMECVVEEKLKEFPDREEYHKKVNDMKMLTKIYKKHKARKELTKDELRFLYEIDEKITGFGYRKDPRIDEIINERNCLKKDIAIILNCSEEQIALNKRKLNKDTVYYHGDLSLNDYKEEKELILPKYVKGSVELRGLTSSDGLVLPEGIGGDLWLTGLTSAEGLKLPQSIGGGLYLDNLTDVDGLTFPETVGGDLALGNLRIATNVNLPKCVGSTLFLMSLKSGNSVLFPEKVGGDLLLYNLKECISCTFPRYVNGDVEISKLEQVQNLEMSGFVGGGLSLSNLSCANTLILPKRVNGKLELRNLCRIKKIIFPEIVGGPLNMESLTSADELILPKKVSFDVDLYKLYKVKSLVLPEDVGGYVDLSHLQKYRTLVLPKRVGSSLYMNGLNTVDSLILPEYIGQNVNMSNLSSIGELVLPKRVGNRVALKSLKSIDGLVIPEDFEYSIQIFDAIVDSTNINMFKNNKRK